MSNQQDTRDMKIRSVYEKLERISKLCHSFAMMQRVIEEEIEYEINLSTIKRIIEGATKPSTAHFYLYTLKNGLSNVLANRDELILKGIDLVKGDKVRTAKGVFTLPLKRQDYFLLLEFVWRDMEGSKPPYKDSVFVDVKYNDNTEAKEVLSSEVEWNRVLKYQPSKVNFQHNIELVQNG